MKEALIVGITGQDGTLLAQLLRQRSIPYLGLNTRGIIDATGQSLGPLDLRNAGAVAALIKDRRPSHVFYLAAHHHSAQDKLETGQEELWKTSMEVNVLGLVHVLEAIRLHAPEVRLFYASSSHVFGSPADFPQTEATPLAPENVYGITKVAGHHACRYYRDNYGQFASVGILYNHESIHRSPKFLSKKIILGALAIKEGRQDKLLLGDLSAEVDWGYAPDYVDAMVRILEASPADDFIIASGQLHTVRDFVRIVFTELGLEEGKYVEENPALIRKQKNRLAGETRHLRTVTGWKLSVTFAEMVRELVRQTLAARHA
jgi:GDPmannose 4,6-dehydratase